jgi:predicted secreted protein
MKKYSRDDIDKMIQPLMKMMQEEFPNNCKLIIEPYYSAIVYEHDEMILPSNERKKPLGETLSKDGINDFVKTLVEVAKKNVEQEQTESDVNV